MAALFAGIDAGSRALKVVVYDADASSVRARAVRDQGLNQAALAAGTLDELLWGMGCARSEVRRIVATGYGRSSIEWADEAVTEITCHARGVHAVVPGARLVVDIGGQDSKVLWLDEQGRVKDFVMNDRCAAGTGRFLEVVAGRLGTEIGALGPLAAGGNDPKVISSTCVVFAETEIVSLLASSAAPADIAAGVQKAVATRVAAMAGRRLVQPVIFTGGVARVGGMKEALETALGCAVQIAPHPQFTGALGAAHLAAEHA